MSELTIASMRWGQKLSGCKDGFLLFPERDRKGRYGYGCSFKFNPRQSHSASRNCGGTTDVQFELHFPVFDNVVP